MRGDWIEREKQMRLVDCRRRRSIASGLEEGEDRTQRKSLQATVIQRPNKLCGHLASSGLRSGRNAETERDLVARSGRFFALELGICVRQICLLPVGGRVPFCVCLFLFSSCLSHLYELVCFGLVLLKCQSLFLPPL